MKCKRTQKKLIAIDEAVSSNLQWLHKLWMTELQMNKAVIVTIKTTLPLQHTHFIYLLCIKYNFKDSFYCLIILSSIKKEVFVSRNVS